MKMKKLHYSLVVGYFFLCMSDASAQAKTRKLSQIINHPSFNVYAPYLSADGNAIVFLSDNAEDNQLAPFYTSRDNADWKEPTMLPRNIHSRLNFLKGYGISSDGKKLYYSSLKTPSVGGFDIWTADIKGSSWSEPVNVALPINTPLHEACPSVTTDGNTMYFMRCNKMDQNKAESCKLFQVQKKPNGQWGEPSELPSHINTGNSQTPRIMADGQSLIFSSDKMTGNKGGMDVYMTTLMNGTWGKPVPYDFINTEQDDQYVSVAALGRYITRDTKGTRRNEIVEYLIPNELRPKGMMKIDGRVTGPDGNPIAAYISIVDLTSRKQIYTARPNADGSFMLYLMEGSTYEISVDPEQDNGSFYTRRFDLTTERIPQIEKVSAVLKPVTVGDEFALERVVFKPYSSQLDLASSSAELKKLMRVIKGSPNLKFEFQVLLTGYEQDSIPSSPDLTEVIYDSIHTTIDDIDTLGQLYQRDTVIARTTFHNDRTRQQAQSIVNYFISQGINETNLAIFGNAIPATLPEEKKLTVKATVRKK
jgi:hypothetical protein